MTTGVDLVFKKMGKRQRLYFVVPARLFWYFEPQNKLLKYLFLFHLFKKICKMCQKQDAIKMRKKWGHDAQHCDSDYNNINHIIRKCSHECLNFTQCCCSECRYAKCHGAKKFICAISSCYTTLSSEKGWEGDINNWSPITVNRGISQCICLTSRVYL